MSLVSTQLSLSSTQKPASEENVPLQGNTSSSAQPGSLTNSASTLSSMQPEASDSSPPSQPTAFRKIYTYPDGSKIQKAGRILSLLNNNISSKKNSND